MAKVRNIYTEKEYTAMQYSQYCPEQLTQCRDFINSSRIRVIMPNLYITDLERADHITEIKPTDYILREISNKNSFRVVSQDIFRSNFEIVA